MSSASRRKNGVCVADDHHPSAEWYDFVNSRELAPPDFFDKSSGEPGPSKDTPGPENEADDNASEAGPSTPAPIAARETRSTRSAKVGVIKQLEKKKPKLKSRSAAKAKMSELESAAPSETGTPVPEDQSNVTPQQETKEDDAKVAEEDYQERQITPMVAVDALADVASMQVEDVADRQPLETPQKPDGEPRSEEGASVLLETPANATMTADSAAGTPAPEGTSIAGGDSTRKRTKRPIVPTNVPDDEEWREFVQVYDELPYGARKEDYTVEAAKEIEAQYWRSVAVGKEPAYGADTKGVFRPRLDPRALADLVLNREPV